MPLPTEAMAKLRGLRMEKRAPILILFECAETEESMEKRFHANTAGKPGVLDEKKKPAISLAKDTKMARDTVTPEENDPLWEQLGSTRVTGAHGDASQSGDKISAPANLTEMSPSLVIGKDVVALGDFRLLRKLGEGAMGAVYKAQQVSYNRVVALKILFPHIANNPKLVERLYREGRTMFELDHPNIVTAYAVDEAEGCHFVAMEYVSGRSMQKWLTQLGRLPVGDSVRVTLDCARALHYAHERNMVHRDVKPDNILLSKKGHVKLADLGMVKIDDEEMSLTQTGHAVGTPWFMPLEQARNAKEIDGRSDIYALGCTLYAFLTGHPPFIGRTIVDVIRAKENGSFPPARQVNSDVPERLDLILLKMIAKSPKNRYQSCEELIKDLESLGLASETLGFIETKPAEPQEPISDDYGVMSKTSVTAPSKSRADVDFAASAAPTLDPDVWYVQLKMPDGAFSTRKYTTAQLHKMLADGTIKPTAHASHQPDAGFRTLGTYKQFQGAALSSYAKKGADKNTARYRGLYKKIEDNERDKAEKERASEDEHETTMQATRRYWFGIFLKVLPAALGVIGVIIFLAWLAGAFSSR